MRAITPAGIGLAASLLVSCPARIADPVPVSGDGPLELRASIAVHDEPWALALADVDGDGRLDALVGGKSLTILLGDGRGGWTQASGSPVSDVRAASDFAFADFDEDGRTEIAIAEHNRPRFYVLRANALGAFVNAPGSPYAVDAEPHVHTVATCDFNGDGHADLVLDSWPQSKLVLVAGRGDGSFATPGTLLEVPKLPIGTVRAADVNGDGRADLVTPAHDSDGVSVLLGDGRGFSLAPGAPFRSFGGFSMVLAVDIDRDGDCDVLESHASDPSTRFRQDALSVLLNDGRGRFEHARGSPFLELSGRAGALAAGDTDGDGWLDIAVACEKTGAIALFRGGASGFAHAGTTEAGRRIGGVAMGDLDGDGRAEVLVTDSDADRLIVLAERSR
jgi:hypothetical protein